MAGSLKYVVFPLGGRDYALDAAEVVELLHSGNVLTFPHTTPGLIGVMMHRNRTLAVWDAAQALIGPHCAPQKYYLIARGKFAGIEELTAIPVSGECKMLDGEVILSVPEGSPNYVRCILLMDGKSIEVLDLELLAASHNSVRSPEPADGLRAGQE